MIKFPSNIKQAIKASEALIYIAPSKHFNQGKYKKIIDGNWWSQLKEPLRDISGGLMGKTLETWTGTKDISRIFLGILPEKVSRNNSPTRKESIYKVSQGINQVNKSTVILVLDKEEHFRAATAAIARRVGIFSMKKDHQEPTIHIFAFLKNGTRIIPNKSVKAIAKSVPFACMLVDTPPTDMNPNRFVQEVKKALRGKATIKIKEIVGDKLLDAGLTGIHAVGRTAIQAPRLLCLEYKPKAAKQKIALVGKGVTYDTGGLSLKISGNMVGMKSDCGGAAAVAAAFLTLVEGGTPHHIIATLGLVENAIGPNAYKPDDILEMHSGLSVEINNTDAEGRVVLADAISWTCRKYKPDIVLDAATLTGAQMVATGNLHAGFVTNSDNLENKAKEAGKKSGDLVAPLPFAPEFFKSEFTSSIADMKNSVKNRGNAQASCAAQFIFNHIEDLDVEWGHIDLAGPSTDSSNRGTGFGVCLMAELAGL